MPRVDRRYSLRGDKLVPLDDRLAAMEREITILRYSTIVLVVLHIPAVPELWPMIQAAGHLFSIIHL